MNKHSGFIGREGDNCGIHEGMKLLDSQFCHVFHRGNADSNCRLTENVNKLAHQETRLRSGAEAGWGLWCGLQGKRCSAHLVVFAHELEDRDLEVLC